MTDTPAQPEPHPLDAIVADDQALGRYEEKVNPMIKPEPTDETLIDALDAARYQYENDEHNDFGRIVKAKEALRARLAEKDAEAAKWKQRADKYMWQVRDTCARAEAAEKALAEREGHDDATADKFCKWLAEALGVTEWDSDGASECWDGDAHGELMRILRKADVLHSETDAVAKWSALAECRAKVIEECAAAAEARQNSAHNVSGFTTASHIILDIRALATKEAPTNG
jgi:hypothetical protein